MLPAAALAASPDLCPKTRSRKQPRHIPLLFNCFMTTKTKNLEKIKKKTFGLTEKLEHSSLKDLINWNTTKRPKKKRTAGKKKRCVCLRCIRGQSSQGKDDYLNLTRSRLPQPPHHRVQLGGDWPSPGAQTKGRPFVFTHCLEGDDFRVYLPAYLRSSGASSSVPRLSFPLVQTGEAPLVQHTDRAASSLAF
jgi:hypothetical protein